MIPLLKALFKRQPARISLLHATRGRPERPLKCRETWLAMANKPLRVEHLFAIDSDDAIAREALAPYSPLVVEQVGLGCVGAWNKAAEHASGDILVQLSDDWVPVKGWDDLFEQRLGSLSEPKVLVISDGHRTDDLLCMAIINRKRMEQQGWFLPPAYTGVYSDDEFSFRAYEDGVTVDARDVILTHEHPNYDSSIPEDETYRRQNDDARYKEARQLFLQRNPAAKTRWLVKDNWSARVWSARK
jgi:hypothetical protein